jgi:hypothetical protein
VRKGLVGAEDAIEPEAMRDQRLRSSFREPSVFNSIGVLTVSNGKNSWWW